MPASPLPCAFTPPPRSQTANDHEVLNGFGRRPASPQSVPLLVRPGSTVRAELAPPHDLRADARGPGAGESVVDAGAAAGLALHGAEGTSREEPLVQPGSRMPKRGIQALPRAGAEPIQRHREVVHPDLRHDDLLTSCLTATGPVAAGATSEDDPLAQSHRQRLAAEHHTCESPGVPADGA